MTYSPDGRVLVSGGSDGSILLFRLKDGARVATLRAVSDQRATYVLAPSGHIEILGPEACSARIYPVCRVGALTFPFDVCEERFLVSGLLPKLHAGDASFTEPESAPTLMSCPSASIP